MVARGKDIFFASLTDVSVFIQSTKPTSLSFFFFLNDPAPPEIYTLPLHAALPILRTRVTRRGLGPDHRNARHGSYCYWPAGAVIPSHCARNAHWSVKSSICIHTGFPAPCPARVSDRKSTRLNSSHDQISYAVFCLK